MKQTALRYGLYSAILLVIFVTVSLLLAPKIDFDTQEVIGYLSILLSMIFVFLGMRYYRNEKNNGFLSFGQGLKLGILITLLPSVLFGLFNILYTNVINTNFHQEYISHYLGQMKASLTPKEFEEQKKAFEKNME